jgi:hypothetical protein
MSHRRLEAVKNFAGDWCGVVVGWQTEPVIGLLESDRESGPDVLSRPLAICSGLTVLRLRRFVKSWYVECPYPGPA